MADGHIVYQGPASQSAEYFKMLESSNCNRYANPPDYFMRILSLSYPKTLDDEIKIKGYVDRYENECKPQIL